jgi:hypothetical protein
VGNSSAPSSYVLHDLVDQPNFNPSTQNNRGDWSLRDVSQGAVFPDPASGKPCCQSHGAMNCVVPDMTLWRCLICGRAAYATRVVSGE